MCSSSSSSFVYGVPREVDEEEDRRRRYHHLQGDLSDILVRSIFTTTPHSSDDDKFIINDDDQHHHHHHHQELLKAAAQGNDDLLTFYDLQQADCVDLLTSGRHLGVDDNSFASRADVVDPLMMVKCTTNSTTSANNNHVDMPLMINMKPASNVLDHAASSYLNSSTATTFRSGLVTTPANKRRKSSVAKKVVCVPAPSPANSRPSGEVVPCDLWAWRKYGQKPIKGSPYPRGYYRCSSSKSCSARKQVERSRKDPNMLVITYTSDHNHPWPTQRNALAGSTRSQSSKNYNNNRRLISSTNNNTSKHMMIDDPAANHQMSNNNTSMIKEELRNDHATDNNQLYTSYQDNNEHTIYKPTIGLMPPAEEYYYDQHVEQNSQDDFFAEFGKVDGNGAAFSYLDYWPLLDHQMQTLLPLNDVPEAEEETEF